MGKIDFQEEFVKQLSGKVPRRSQLIDDISDLLVIERDAAYRRLSGKVSFTLREAGIIAEKYNLSIDQITRKSQDAFWLPFFMSYPMQVQSTEGWYDLIIERLNRVERVTRGENSESGNIYNSMPIEFLLLSPLLSKFIFFKWGNFLVATEEFDKFSSWDLSPVKFEGLVKKVREAYRFEKIYYVWDESIVWDLCRDISSFHRLKVISSQEMKDLASELKSVLGVIENALDTNENPIVSGAAGMDFYVSPFNTGFISHYFKSSEGCSMMFETNYTFSMIENCSDSCERLKGWMDSFLHMSVQLSKSARRERNIFFNNQYKTIDHILK